MMNTIDLELYKTFYYTAKAGSLTKASKLLGSPKSKISKDLSKLEELLESKFLNRTHRGTSLTSEGQYLFKHIQSSIEKLVEGPAFLENQIGQLKGTVKLTAPEDICETILIDTIKEFQNLHPKIKIELYATTEILNIDRSDIDIALRVGRLKDSALLQKKIATLAVKYYADKSYLKKYKTINSINNLSDHKLATIKTLDGVLVKKLNFDENSIHFCSNSMVILKRMALTQNYITTLPEHYCSDEVSKARLQNILPDEYFYKGSLYLVSKPNKFVPKHIQEFKNFIVNSISIKLK